MIDIRCAVLEPPIPSSSSSSTESTNPVIKTISLTNETNSQQTKLSAFIKRPVGVIREKKINDLIFKMIVKRPSAFFCS